ncbi:hypothetical protein LPU83_pLPU83c_0222 (plasmid) [Rhizobium favelukesii]|uniref:Uncharacterized protein n=1 Tax=Rhizobium favelukesii TaxID=348824 RepID=W6RIU1_9HYPH|nr:hypothetical protein LPU83_pLPU83c_0222 [Rhizobium favelukesii]
MMDCFSAGSFGQMDPRGFRTSMPPLAIMSILSSRET